MFKSALLLFVSYFLVSMSFAQVKITGKVVDASDGQSIPFVHVFLSHSQYGTITNEDGEFELKPADGDSIVISHISYETQKLKVSGQVLVKLNPKATILSEVVVSDFASQTVRRAFQEAMKHLTENKYGKGFYRQVTMMDTVPIEVYEVFYALETNIAGVKKQAIEESRYAKKKRNENEPRHVHFTNLSVLTLGKIFSEETEQTKAILIPLMPQSDGFYDFSVVDRIKDGTNELVKVHFAPAADCKKPSIEGDMIVNLTTHHVLHMDFETHFHLGMDKLTSPSGTLTGSNHLFRLSYDFRESINGVELNFIRSQVDLDFTTESNIKFHASANASLVLYQQGLKKIKRLEQTDLAKDDLEQLKKKKYNPSFWKDNPIVKRTPLDEKIISVFEKDGSFGTLFSN